MASYPSLFIFDLDGTLIEYELDYVFSHALKHLSDAGYPEVNLASLRHYFGLDQMFGFAPAEDHERLSQIFWNEFDRGNYPLPRAIPGVTEALSYFKERNIKMAIVTSRLESIESVQNKLRPAGILDYMKYIASRHGTNYDWHIKAGLYLKACAACEVLPEFTWVIGDCPSDIASAHEAGVGRAIGVLTGGIYSEVLEKEKPDAILQSVRDLPRYCEEN